MNKIEQVEKYINKLSELPDKDCENYKDAVTRSLVYVINDNTDSKIRFRIILNGVHKNKHFRYDDVEYDIRKYVELENGRLTKNIVMEKNFFNFFNGLRESNKNRIIEMIEEYILDNV